MPFTLIVTLFTLVYVSIAFAIFFHQFMMSAHPPMLFHYHVIDEDEGEVQRSIPDAKILALRSELKRMEGLYDACDDLMCKRQVVHDECAPLMKAWNSWSPQFHYYLQMLVYENMFKVETSLRIDATLRDLERARMDAKEEE